MRQGVGEAFLFVEEKNLKEERPSTKNFVGEKYVY